jgi:hypothetical protein
MVIADRVYTNRDGISVAVGEHITQMIDYAKSQGYTKETALSGVALHTECAVHCGFAGKTGIVAFESPYSAYVLFADGRLHAGIFNQHETNFALA